MTKNNHNKKSSSAFFFLTTSQQHKQQQSSYKLPIISIDIVPYNMISLTFALLLSLAQVKVHAFGVTEPVSALLEKHVSDIARLKEETQAIVGSIDESPYNNDVFYLRYCLDDKGIDELKENLAWRQGAGKEICTSAIKAVQKASEGDKWNNAPVQSAAPFSEKICKYITPSNLLTTPSSNGDLLYCIKAGAIDDNALMSSLDSVDNMVEFFLYSKEVNALVANDRSLTEDKLIYVLTVNDLQNLALIGGDATFRQALSTASKQATQLYPGLSGPTLLLNLPRLVSALVKLFTPLFPPQVQERIKFERGPLDGVNDLMTVSFGGPEREKFLKDIDVLVY